ncbi:glycosyltransferase [Campylobacter iguaniorum]|uniref:glycosyltransferase n=1 Tax=Campylobacter iguaniorum TaxID=1244531 RepID=UPI00073A3C01|nr:glycosyltransferase [Campylobacter iguaniorum]
MKIMFFISAIRNGGSERVLEALCNEFVKCGESCEIVYFEEDLGLYKFDCKKTHLNIYEKSGIWTKFSKFIKIRKYIKCQKPDVIISFMDQTNINLIISTAFMKVNLIVTEHVSHNLLKSKFWRFIRDFSYKFADGLSVLSAVDFEYYKFVKNKALMYNPVFKSGSLNLPKQNVILSVGRLENVKGYDIYLQALSLVDRGLLKGWEVWIAGSGSLENELKQMAINLGLEVKFLGHVNDVSVLYEKAKILALSSKSEGFGNVLVEAIFYDVLRVATPTNGANELIKNGFDGFISSDFSPKSFACELEKVLKDENLRENLTKNANLKRDEFDIKNIIQKWYKFIKECEK